MEIEILSMLQKIRTPLLDIFMSNITKLGNAGIVWILLTIVLLLIPKTRKSGLILASAFFEKSMPYLLSHNAGDRNRTDTGV